MRESRLNTGRPTGYVAISVAGQQAWVIDRSSVIELRNVAHNVRDGVLAALSWKRPGIVPRSSRMISATSRAVHHSRRLLEFLAFRQYRWPSFSPRKD